MNVGLEDGSGLDVIYLDYKKAFDTVPHHQKLLQKLKGLRLGDMLTKWIEQFLLGRQMRVHVNGSFSSWIDVIRSPTGICVRTTVILDICQQLVRLD